MERCGASGGGGSGDGAGRKALRRKKKKCEGFVYKEGDMRKRGADGPQEDGY